MTPYRNIFERFSTKVQDFTLDALFTTSETDYESYLYNFLKAAIPKFIKCKTNLQDRDETNKQFNQTLSELEEEILAEMMKVEWAEKEVNNVLEMRLGLSGPDFKRYAESNNMKAKMDLRDSMQERVDNLLIRYSYSSFDFTQS